jgi:crossover junction endonuclease MUS81
VAPLNWSYEIRSRDDRNYLTERLEQLGISTEVRNLELGDFIWIARRNNNTNNTNNNNNNNNNNTTNNNNNNWTDSEEIVLNVLIERKRIDDLIASISDGRFKEQKHRISRSLMSETFYLVERSSAATGNMEFLGGFEERLLSAALQCQVLDGLMYRQTGGLDESIVFLAALHAKLKLKFHNREITGCALKAVNFNYTTFPIQLEQLRSTSNADSDSFVHMNYTAFALLNNKSSNQSASDLFLKQLMSVKGVTFDKACALLAAYPSPLKLHRFYQSLHEQLRQDALANLIDPRRKKQFGRALSCKIYQVFSQNTQ